MKVRPSVKARCEHCKIVRRERVIRVICKRIVDLMGSDREPARMRFGLILDCTLQAREAAGALLVEEECEGAARFTNRFFANTETGAVFRAEQWVGDRIAPLEIEFLNPSAN